MAVTLVDWLNDGTIPQNKASGNWTPSAFNTGKFRFTLTFTNASTHSQWRPASLTYWGILTTNEANGSALWLEWNPSGSTHTLIFVAADGSTILGSKVITWGAGSAVTIVTDQSSATAGASTMTISGASTGNGTSSGWTRASVFSGANLYFGVWGSGGFQLPAGSTTTSDIDDGNDGRTATGAVTLGAATPSAAGQLAIKGTAAATLGAATSSAVGALAIAGAAAITLAAATVSAAGAGSGIQGSAAITLADAVPAAAGALAIRATSAVVLDAATPSATGVHAGTGTAAVTLGAATASAAGALAIRGSSGVTLAAATPSAQGTLAIRGQAAISLGAATVAASNVDFSLGDYGAARVLYGTPAGTCTVTLDTAASTTIVVVTGGALGDLATAPTDNKGNTYTAVGAAEEYARWPGYGIRAWICLDAGGGANHAISQQFGQTNGFDEVTICAWEVRGAELLQASAIVERASATTAVCGSVSTTAPAVILQAWSGDATTGATSSVSISDGTVIDTTTLVDHPNGYVPIAMAYAAKTSPQSGYAPTWTHSPTQGAIVVTVALQAVEGRTATGSPALSNATLAAAGEHNRTASAAVTLGAATVSATGALVITGGAAPTLANATIAAQGALAIRASSAPTLADAAISAAGAVALRGTAAAVLVDTSLVGQGALALRATAGVTLDAATPSAQGRLAITGAAGATLSGATVSGNGNVGSFASVAMTLDAASLSSGGALAIAGSGAATLAPATLTSAAALAISGAGAPTLTDAAIAAIGTSHVTEPEPEPETPQPHPGARAMGIEPTSRSSGRTGGRRRFWGR